MTAVSSVRRARTLNWPFVGFIAAHSAGVLATLLLMSIFGSRLPSGAGDFAALVIRTELFAVGFLLLPIAWQRDNRASFALETALPLSLGIVGSGFFALASAVLINFDAHTYQSIFEVPVGLGVLACGAVMSLGLGRYLGSAAAIRRLRREAASGRRSAWLAEVNVDRSWRLAFGALFGVPTAMLIVIVLPSATTSPALVAGLVINWAVAVAVGQKAAVFINDAGIRVSGRLVLGAPSWSLPLAHIASVRGITARPLDMLLSAGTGLCILRSGPALEVTSTTGRSYAVSLPEAQEAVSVLDRLLERRARGEIAPGAGTD
jgi:hypothetical protein